MGEAKFTLFGTNLEKIPCFKRTFTFSTFSGIAAGLGTFLFTSKAKKSADVAVASFLITSLGFWVHCRYNWAKEYAITSKMNRNLHEVMVNQGVKQPPKEDV